MFLKNLLAFNFSIKYFTSANTCLVQRTDTEGKSGKGLYGMCMTIKQPFFKEITNKVNFHSNANEK